MSTLKKSIMDIWERGDTDELEREDLIDIAVYFENPDQQELIDDEHDDGDDEEDQEESGPAEATEPPVTHHGPMKITVTNVLVDGYRNVKVIVENMKQKHELPAKYLEGTPNCYLSDAGTTIIYQHKGAFGSNVFVLDVPSSIIGVEMLIEQIKACSERLAEVKKEIEDDKANWEGKETVYVI